jgi:membrane associated rhomboid family serine protease
MLPLADHNPRHRFPFVNYTLIALNVLAFLWELSLGPDLQRVLFDLAFVPRKFFVPGHWDYDIFSAFFSMFLHGGFMHIGSNMLYLWIFGDNIEDRLGHVRYTIFYFACGMAATLAHAFAAPGSMLPAIGASGAIAGVLGGYIILFPHAQISTIVPIFFVVTVQRLPAIVILGLWFVLQIFSGVGSLGVSDAQDMGGVAWFAHIGGFVAGMILIVLMGGRRPPRGPAPAYYEFR